MKISTKEANSSAPHGSKKAKRFLSLLLCWLAVVIVCPPAWAQTGPSRIRSIKFRVSPPNAKVYQVGLDGRVDALGTQGGELNVELSAIQTDDRSVFFLFSVPQWFGGEYPDWKNQTDLSKLKQRYQREIKAGDLKGTLPTDGQPPITLELPAKVAFQAWTLVYRGWILFLFALGGLLFAAVIFRHKLLALLPGSAAVPVEKNEVDGYDLRKKIGEGGMGEVWAATSVSNLNCALKFIRKELAQDEEFKARFEREIKACLPLDHPHLLKLYGYGVATDGRLYTVSELLIGQTLKAVIKSKDYDPPQLAAQVIEQIGDALYYLHEKKLIHRDVKPDNIFVCEDGSMKLMDMGLIEGEALTVVTQTGHMLGTPAYMPPEQMGSSGGKGRKISQAERMTSPASDQYALGIITYEILAGERPFDAPTAAILVYQQAHVAPPPPTDFEPRITPDVEKSILRMISKKPEERFPSLKDVQSALEPLSFMSWKDTGEETHAASIKKVQL